MREDNGVVVETVDDVHECFGENIHQCPGEAKECEAPVCGYCEPAMCEDCGQYARLERPVYVWTVESGITFFICRQCMRDDQYATLMV
jgi:hypothetical protein